VSAQAVPSHGSGLAVTRLAVCVSTRGGVSQHRGRGEPSPVKGLLLSWGGPSVCQSARCGVSVSPLWCVVRLVVWG